MTREEQRAKVLAQFAEDPQASHLANQALDEMYGAMDRLRAMGSPLEAQESVPVPVEYPKWVDGALYESDAAYKAAATPKEEPITDKSSKSKG